MVKKRGLIIAVVLVLILACMNIFLFSNKGEISYTAISGRFIEDIPESLLSLNISFIIFALQWIVLILIIIVVYLKFLKHKKDYLTQQDYQLIKQKKIKSETDLDILYELLKNKKKLNITTISKVFGISKDTALEWAKILENYELTTINYPTFRSPEVRINEEKPETGKTEKGKQKEEKGKTNEEKPEKGKAGKREKQKTGKTKQKTK